MADAVGGGTRVLDVVIVEDEERAVETLRGLLATDPEVRVVAETSGAAAPAVIQTLGPDILLLDVQMPDLDGFGVLDRLSLDPGPVVVFVTAYDEHALAAFDVAAVDYLLKPFSDERFRTALERAKARARSPAAERSIGGSEPPSESGPPLRPGRSSDWILVRGRGRTRLVPAKDVDWIEGEGVYVRLHVGDRSHLVRASLADLEARLEPHGFFRIHRSTVVNVDRIVELRHQSHGDYSVHLEDGTRLKLSRTRRASLEEALGEPLV